MTLERIEHKVFASEAPLDEMGQFGSALATTKLNTKDVAEIQALPAYTQGWGSAIISENNYPPMEEMNGVLNVMSYHTGYLYQEGIPTYSSTQEYSATSWVKDLAGEKIYKSLQDRNKGHDLTDPAWWMELKFGGSGFNLFDTKISDHLLEGETAKGWALQGTYIYKEALAGSRYGYPDFYNKVIEEYNEATNTEIVNGVTVKVNSNGHKFYDIADKIAIDEFFNNMGTAWFYGVDTENERIFLPRDKYFAVKGDVSVAGNGMTLGFIDGKGGNYVPYGQHGQTHGAFNSQGFGEMLPFTKSTSGGNFTGSNVALGITTDSTKSGIEGKLITNEDKYLYICVGNTTNYEGMTDVVNQGMEILEQVNQGIESRVKLDGSNAEFIFITETYQNGSSWYRVYSDGWCEQGGYLASTSTNHLTRTITFLKPFKDTTYNYQQTTGNSLANNQGYGVQWGWISGTKTTTSIQTDTASATYQEGFNWQASGYIA